MRSLILICGFLLFLVSCSQDGPPFEAEFLGRETVVVRYHGKEYTLRQYGPHIDAPFQYAFEPDGDLDLIVDGRRYEIDNPYDVDPVRKKKGKKYKRNRRQKKKRR